MKTHEAIRKIEQELDITGAENLTKESKSSLQETSDHSALLQAIQAQKAKLRKLPAHSDHITVKSENLQDILRKRFEELQERLRDDDDDDDDSNASGPSDESTDSWNESTGKGKEKE
jgi:DNA repair exonuclease SbcCD ATPase subunit